MKSIREHLVVLLETTGRWLRGPGHTLVTQTDLQNMESKIMHTVIELRDAIRQGKTVVAGITTLMAGMQAQILELTKRSSMTPEERQAVEDAFTDYNEQASELAQDILANTPHEQPATPAQPLVPEQPAAPAATDTATNG